MHAYPPRGGNHRHAYELVQGFLKRGHIVHVVDDPEMPGANSFENDTQNLDFFLDTIDILYVRVDSRSMYDNDVFDYCLKRSRNVPIVWEVNASPDENLAFSWLGGGWKEGEGVIRRLRRKIHACYQMPKILKEERYRKLMAKNVTHAICVSSSVQKYCINDLGVKEATVICNGGPKISLDEIKSRKSKRTDNRFTVVYTGSAIYPWQGLPFLNRVVEIAEQQKLGINFKIAVNQRSEMLPKSKNVSTFIGLDQEEVKDLICTSDVCLALIPEWNWAKYGFHGSPTKIYEYMALMMPVITSSHGQMSELLEDQKNCILCNNQPDKILEAILTLRNNDTLLDEIAYTAWSSVQEYFNWDRVVDDTLEIFQGLVK